MYLYTLIFEYLGGTYAFQVSANDEKEAINNWLKDLDVSEIANLDEQEKQALIEDFNEEGNELTLVTGLNNVWCTGVLRQDEFQLLHIIKTLANN